MHLLIQTVQQKATQHSMHTEAPPGFAKAVGTSSRSDQQRESPDDVLASSFSRNLNMDEPSQGRASHIFGNSLTATLPSHCLTQHCPLSSRPCYHAGARMHASQSAQRLGSSGDASTSGRPCIDGEINNLAPGRQMQPVHAGINARYNAWSCL